MKTPPDPRWLVTPSQYPLDPAGWPGVPPKPVLDSLLAPRNLKVSPVDDGAYLSLDDLVKEWEATVERLKRMFPRLNHDDCQDIVQTVFLKLLSQGIGILGKPCLASFLRLVYRTAIDLIRHRKRGIRGGGAPHVSWDKISEIDGLPCELFGRFVSTREQIENTQRMIELIRETLSSRETVCLRLLAETLPDVPSSSEALLNLTDMERQLFEPKDGRTLTDKDRIHWINRQITRSFSVLRQKLRIAAVENDWL